MNLTEYVNYVLIERVRSHECHTHTTHTHTHVPAVWDAHISHNIHIYNLWPQLEDVTTCYNKGLNQYNSELLTSVKYGYQVTHLVSFPSLYCCTRAVLIGQDAQIWNLFTNQGFLNVTVPTTPSSFPILLSTAASKQVLSWKSISVNP